MPIASVARATAVNPGLFRSVRPPNFRSWSSSLMGMECETLNGASGCRTQLKKARSRGEGRACCDARRGKPEAIRIHGRHPLKTLVKRKSYEELWAGGRRRLLLCVLTPAAAAAMGARDGLSRR